MSPKNLNPQQQQAAYAPIGPLLIAAGAGTGKTKTLTHRLLYLLKQGGVPADQVCALTFTNKAAKEMADRVWRESPELARRQGNPFIGTFHSFGSRILRAESRLFGRTPNFVIFDDHDSFDLIKKLLKQDGRAKSDEGPAFFRDKISALKNGMVRHAELRASRKESDVYALELFRRYENTLKKNNAFDFDDLIYKVVRLFHVRPSVRDAYRQRFSCMLVDEYQDLNNMQYELVRLLVGPSHNLSVVGDDQQTIYSWRGSNFEIFLNFERDWPESKVVLLEENYRSTANIIQAASALIAHNRRQKPKQLWTKNPPGERVKLFEAYDENGEAAWIAEEIERSRIKNEDAGAAVLYRTNAQSRAIEQALIAKSIPYRIFGGLKFYERREVKDVVAALRYAMNPKDQVSSERLEKLLGKGGFAALKEKLARADASSPLALVHFFLENTGYLGIIDRNLTNPQERKENIAELMRFASEFSELPQFLEQIALLQATDSLKPEDRPQHSLPHLLTIHLAKGLEFDTVFVAGASEGLLPHARSMERDAELEEERRLMYVAMTRAQKRLHISFYDLPSRFLSELPGELLEFKSVASDETAFTDNEERYITID